MRTLQAIIDVKGDCVAAQIHCNACPLCDNDGCISALRYKRLLRRFGISFDAAGMYHHVIRYQLALELQSDIKATKIGI